MSHPTKARVVILVVEDEPLLRMMAVDMVEDAGFEAVEATDATHAIESLDRRTNIRIVFSDMDTPRGVGPVTMMQANAQAVRRALEAVGIEFIDRNGGGSGVRLRDPLP